MKTTYFFFALLVSITISIHSQEPPTDAGIPDANHVLVVYNTLSDTSFLVANYYKNKRSIPATNIVGISLPDTTVTIDGSTHRVKIVQVTDIIQDSVQHANNNAVPTRHAFKYFLDYIATPIKTHLVNNNLLSTIRYIVLCKGVPFKIQAARDYGGFQRGNLTVDGLLCMLNTPDYDSLILDDVFNNNSRSNPYRDIDPNFTMEYRFLPDHFIANEGHQLSYLVSHLDGISYNVVKGIIDRSIEPDMSGTAAWIIDDDPTWSGGHFTDTRDKLEELGFNVFYDYSNTWITSYPGNVMGYTSWGTHAEDGNCEWEDSAWVKDSLHFDLANGSVFNTYESFNGTSLTTLKWRYVYSPPPDCHHTQGLATQFTEIGGTGTMGHAWEPGGGGVVSNNIFFPAYQMGYNLVDAFYQGLPSLAWQNVLVGDPLVRIYECENTVISTNTTIGSGDYECNIIVPQNVILTIASGSTLNFGRNASLKVYGTLQVNSNVNLNFNAYSNLIIDSLGTLIISSNADLVFNNHSKFQMKHTFEKTSDYNFVFNDDSEFLVNGLSMDINSNITFNNNSNLSVNGLLYLSPGTTMNINDDSKLKVDGSFESLGEPSNKVTLNFSNSDTPQFQVNNGISLVVDNTTLYNGGLHYSFVSNQIVIEDLSITNTSFNNVLRSSALILETRGSGVNTTPIISNCTFTTCSTTAIILGQLPEIIISHNTIGLQPNSTGIYLINNGTVDIYDCIFSGGKKGIETYSIVPGGLTIIADLLCDLKIEQCSFQPSATFGPPVTSTAIEIAGNNFFNSAIINGNHFEDYRNGIVINAFSGIGYSFIPVISNNVMYGNTNGNSVTGISLSNGNEALVTYNSITNFRTGINLYIVNNPIVLENFISAVDLTSPYSGLVFVSSNGEIRKNTIQHHWHGIELGSASPFIGANTITDNQYYGMYISSDSHPDLSEAFVGEDQYPLSGYNTIRENGICNQLNYSEIYLVKSTITLEKGCNTVADDREEPLSCGYLYLIDGEGVEEEIIANRNYWGEINGSDPEGRFGEGVTVNYEGWLEVPCTYDESSSFIILANSKGDVYDTVYSSGVVASGLTDIETRYANANAYYYNNQYSQAKQEYEGITQNYGGNKASLQAYNRLYTLANLMSSTQAEFNQLKDFYLQKAGTLTDSLMIETLTHLSDLCLVSAEEYLPAINKFDEIAQQNPNTDLALYMQIDALTTALLLPQDSTLNKGILGKYNVNNLSDYTDKLSELLRTRGRSGIESKKDLLPTEYTLYQNYPNPFNPTTTIKYDLPNTSDVTLVIYDILGRKIKELVNTKQQAGRYEVQFDASNLASGVFIYQLIAEKYMQSRKMILLK